MRLPWLLLLFAFAARSHADEPPRPAAPLPDGFVAVADVAPTVIVELRYATAHNFVGTPIAGYEANRALLTAPAAHALRAAQAELETQGLGLKLLDAYRPQRAVLHFLRWAQDPAPSPHAATYHPGLSKRDLFTQGYLALDSAHSRGSAVDVTLVRRQADGSTAELDLGTPFDFFGPAAAFAAPDLTAAQRAYRERLREVMTRHGFVPYEREWWHFELANPSYPETHYDFPVR